MQKKNFKDLFCDFKTAKKLAEIGFQDGCIAWSFPDSEEFLVLGQERTENFHTTFFTPEIIQRPLRQQIFEWFEETHGLIYRPDPPFYDDVDYGGSIYKVGEYHVLTNLKKNYNHIKLQEEAINTMISIVEKKIQENKI